MPGRRKSANIRRHRHALIDPLEPRRLLTTWYVDAAATGFTHNGSSWSAAYADLQLALSSAHSGDTIEVARGTYKPTTGTNRNASFLVNSGVTLLGGFAGAAANPANPDLRDFNAYPTTLSGDIGTPNDNSDNVYHVLLTSGLQAATVIDGFTVTGGNATGTTGGGLYNTIGGSPTVRNCAFVANAATTGGAIWCQGNSPFDVSNCAFVGNSATNGGAVYDGNLSSSSFTNCTFVANTASGSGGAFYNNAQPPAVTNCVFWGNTAATAGGQIYNVSTLRGRTAVVTYSDVQDGYTGTGNISADPLLNRNPSPGPDGKWATADDDYGDVRLQSASPCADAGDNAAVPAALATDLAGNPRLTDLPSVANGPAGWVDLGAYEVPPTPVLTLAQVSARVYENAGTVSLVLQFTGALNAPVTVPILVTGGTADAADYSLPGSVTVPVGQSSATVPITIADDQTVEPSETLLISLGAPTNATLGTPSDFALTILDNDLLYVDARATAGANDGSGWADAFTDLQSALARASKGSTIRVATGTYRPTTTTARSATFALKNNVTLLGGYAGLGAPDPDARDAAAYPTTLSGDIGARGSNADNSYHVVTAIGVNTTAVLDGFTVTGGNANATTAPDEYGGGLYDSGGSPTVRNCTFTANAASIYGGAIYVSSPLSATTFANCTFTANTSTDGGALYNNSSLLSLANCTFTANSAGAVGGAIYNHAFSGGNASTRNCTFTANTASQGGAIFNDSAAPTIADCAFVGNAATDIGGAIVNDYFPSPAAVATVTGCTFVGNTAARAGGAVENINGSPKLTNSILWANTAPAGPQINNVSSTPVVTYSDVQGGYTGTGNIDADPLFVRPPSPGADTVWGTPDDDYGDLRLSAASPCADAGSNSAVPAAVTTDLAGGPRFLDIPTTPDSGAGTGPVVDLGAYEAAPALAAAAGGPYAVLADQPFTLGGRGASDVPGTLAYAWEWTGDGLYDDATGPAPAFPAGAFAPGTHTLSLRVTDAHGRSAVGTTTLRVLPRVAYVDARAAAGDGSGRDWADAFTSLADALAAALPGQTIRVAAGTYKPTATAYRTVSFPLRNGVALYGGYAGYGAADPDARDPLAHPTVLSGDIGAAGVAADNAYHVLVGSGADATAVLDGFTVTAGNANGASSPYDRGGALYDAYGAPTLLDCTFLANAAVYGGAIYNYYVPASTVAGCTFVGNSATYGGAIQNLVSSPVIVNCTFAGNVATTQGGAIENDSYGSPAISNCVFWGNAAPVDPQIDNFNSTATPVVTYCDVQGGYAGGAGNVNADPRFYRNPAAGPDGKWGTADDNYGDLRLLPGSPAIDAGSNSAVPAALTTDPTGTPRITDFPGAGPANTAVVDMGAFEASTNFGPLHLTAGQALTLPAGGYSFTASQLILDPGSTLDLADDALLLDYSGASPLPTIRAALASGFHGGAWTGTGITSSAARTTPGHAIGYAEASDLGLTTFNNQPVDATALLLKYTLTADANLDGKLNADDYALTDRGMAKHLTVWDAGDFNYDAQIDSADYLLLDTAFAPQQSSAASPELLAAREAQFGPQYVDALEAALAPAPEPTTATSPTPLAPTDTTGDMISAPAPVTTPATPAAAPMAHAAQKPKKKVAHPAAKHPAAKHAAAPKLAPHPARRPQSHLKRTKLSH